jgi:hypothetical protein
MAAEARIDIVLRDLAKENAALLELVAYGKSVFPSEAQFEAEHDHFVGNLYEAFSDYEAAVGKPGFVLTATMSDRRELLIKGSFGNVTATEKRPDGDLLDCLLEICAKKSGPIGAKIGAWTAASPYHEIHIVPYLVAKPWDRVLPTEVQARIKELRDNRKLLDEKFIYTTPFRFPLVKGVRGKLPRDPYFRSYACVGVGNEWIQEVGPRVNLYALLEALMVFYQMSWSNYNIIKECEEKQQEEAKAKERETILTFGRIREPIETLVRQLQAAQQPLNRLQAVLSPVRGLFASNVVPEQLYSSSRQKIEIQGGPYFLQVRHSFKEFAEIPEFAGDEARQIDAVAEQIAAVILAGFGELQNAKRPLWEYLRYALHFSDAYRQVANILLRNWQVLQTPSSSLLGQKSRLADLFEAVKYWFNKAGRIGEPMRADFLAAGINLLFPEGSGDHVTMSNIRDSTLFWAPSLLPVQTLSGLEALVREYGNADSARLQLEQQDGRNAVSLTIYFPKTAANALIDTDLEDIQKRCRVFEKRRRDGRGSSAGPTVEDGGDVDDRFRPTRGNMVFAIMELFGGVPEYEEKDGGRLVLSKNDNSMTLTYPRQQTELMPIRITWVAPPPKRPEQAR